MCLSDAEKRLRIKLLKVRQAAVHSATVLDLTKSENTSEMGSWPFIHLSGLLVKYAESFPALRTGHNVSRIHRAFSSALLFIPASLVAAREAFFPVAALHGQAFSDSN